MIVREANQARAGGSEAARVEVEPGARHLTSVHGRQLVVEPLPSVGTTSEGPSCAVA